MYWLIETEEQLEELKAKKLKKIFLEIVPYHHNYHPILSEISLIFIKPFIDDKGYMLCLNHNETFSLDKTLIDGLLTNIDEIYVINKKQKLYHLPYKNLYDLTYLIPDTFKYPENLVYNHFYSKHSNILDLNRIIPVTKHYEYCESLFDLTQKHLPLKYPEEYKFLNSKAPSAFLGIERNGITLSKSVFEKYYDLPHPEYSILEDKIYTEYNLYTTTKRPSNAFNGINFSAIPKDKTRESFIPKNDLLVEFDISAYHPTLAAKLIDFEFDFPNGIRVTYDAVTGRPDIELFLCCCSLLDTDISISFSGMAGIYFTDGDVWGINENVKAGTEHIRTDGNSNNANDDGFDYYTQPEPTEAKSPVLKKWRDTASGTPNIPFVGTYRGDGYEPGYKKSRISKGSDAYYGDGYEPDYKKKRF